MCRSVSLDSDFQLRMHQKPSVGLHAGQNHNASLYTAGLGRPAGVGWRDRGKGKGRVRDKKKENGREWDGRREKGREKREWKGRTICSLHPLIGNSGFTAVAINDCDSSYKTNVEYIA